MYLKSLKDLFFSYESLLSIRWFNSQARAPMNINIQYHLDFLAAVWWIVWWVLLVIPRIIKTFMESIFKFIPTICLTVFVQSIYPRQGTVFLTARVADPGQHLPDPFTSRCCAPANIFWLLSGHYLSIKSCPRWFHLHLFKGYMILDKT